MTLNIILTLQIGSLSLEVEDDNHQKVIKT